LASGCSDQRVNKERIKVNYDLQAYITPDFFLALGIIDTVTH
jgi:hypothetical protein